MRFASLGSGSQGNSLVVTLPGTPLPGAPTRFILIDCGFNRRETVRRLGQLGLSLDGLVAVFVTHEHGDHVSGVFRVAQASARAMVRNGTRGTIINIASILGLRVRTQVAAYAASKAAVVQLTHALALEWAEHGIRVNAIAPGYFETDINRGFFAGAAGQAMLKRVPQRRLGRPADLDGPLLLLCSDASRYMTGAEIAVDGGHLVSSL